MSLLLDALNRASQDKAAAAAAASAEAAAPKPGAMALDLPAREPEAPPALVPRVHLTAPISAPGNDWPTLGLALTPTGATPIAKPPADDPSATGMTHAVDLGLELVTQSEPPAAAQALRPPPGPPSSPKRRGDPPMAVPLPKFEPPAAPPSNRPPPKDAPRVAQSIVRAKAAAPKAARPTRLIALLSIAVLLASGLGSILLGWWGDPMTGFQSAAVTAPAAPAVAIAPVLAPTAPIESTPAQAAALQPPLVVADLAPPRRPGGPPQALRSPSRPTTTVVSAAADRPSTGCAAGLSPAECEVTNRTRSVAAPSKSIEPMLQTRSTGPSALESGYAALTQGRLTEARQAYMQALAGNPQERDALLGLAYIAHQQGRPEEARSYYQRVLRQEPGNAVARAGLLTLSPTEDAQELGSQTRDVAEQNPDSAAAQSVLGHSLVRQGRLAQAQLAFQRAHLLEPGVALHAFNLAVALDHLHRYPAARHYYEHALSLSAQAGGERSSGVPLAVVQERLLQLQADIPAGSPHEQ